MRVTTLGFHVWLKTLIVTPEDLSVLIPPAVTALETCYPFVRRPPPSFIVEAVRAERHPATTNASFWRRGIQFARPAGLTAHYVDP
jgi:hypothetical protein